MMDLVGFEDNATTTFQQTKDKLKQKLIQFKSAEQFSKDKKRKASAQALKFLRKLGRKLRVPHRVRSKPMQKQQYAETPTHYYSYGSG
jgi:hypothetical protein